MTHSQRYVAMGKMCGWLLPIATGTMLKIPTIVISYNLIFLCMASWIGFDATVGVSDLTNEIACGSVGVPTG